MTFQSSKSNPNYNGAIWKGKKHTEETKQKMRKPKSVEHKRKLSESLKGHFSPQKGKYLVGRIEIKCKNCTKKLIIRKISTQTFYNKKCESNYRKGIPLSEVTRLKISIKNKGKKRPDLSKRNKMEKHKMFGDKNPAKRPEVREKLRIKRQKEVLQFHSSMQVGKNEKQILDNLAKKIGYKIIRQYKTIGYFIDGYIPELNLVVEVDEKHHYNKNNNLSIKDIEREQKIKQKLNCQFMRIKDC